MGPSPFSDGNVLMKEASSAPNWLQWGHRLSAMEISVNMGTDRGVRWLQWGHRLSAMEICLLQLCLSAYPERFQWGHRLSAMEITRRGPGGAAVPGASMGPSPFSDGNMVAGFMWLAWLWGLQWGHRLSAMEMPTASTRYPVLRACFNGAIAFQRWKWPADSRGRQAVLPASMGPSPFSDGNAGKSGKARKPSTSFNGAIAFQRWKSAPATPGRQPGTPGFQWGHRLSAMEMSQGQGVRSLVIPLQWGHRLSAMEISRWDPAWTPAAWGFNGAIAFQRWKWRGRRRRSRRSSWLQWGHRLSAMEIGP